jgi:ureidoglycolate lyase
MTVSPGWELPIEDLNEDAFREFGDVIEARDTARRFTINEGYATRFHDLAKIDVSDSSGTICVNIFRALPRSFPLKLSESPRVSRRLVGLSHSVVTV